MICRVVSRDSDACVLLFAQGSYEWGLLDAGTAGTASLVVNAGADGIDYDIVKAGSLLHIFPQRSFDHWYGLITADPVWDGSQRVYRVQATELTAFFGEIVSVASFVPVQGSQEEHFERPT